MADLLWLSFAVMHMTACACRYWTRDWTTGLIFAAPSVLIAFLAWLSILEKLHG